jgi:hypothetical protein
MDAPAIEKVVEANMKAKGVPKHNLRGYALLVTSMVASAAAVTYLTGQLPPDFQFVSQILTQFSTLGIYVFGAPIWEPLSSAVRKLAFGLGMVEKSESARQAEFETLWRRTQEYYSANGQLSRTVLTDYITSVQQNFYQAFQAVQSDNPEYAADQVAEAAFRLHMLFREIPPSDPSVAGAVRAAFINHVKVGSDFTKMVLERIQKLDPNEASEPFYQEVLQAWLAPN